MLSVIGRNEARFGRDFFLEWRKDDFEVAVNLIPSGVHRCSGQST